MHILTPAKINMGLKIVGTLENGYHSLDMVMVPISLYDQIQIEKSTEDKIHTGDVKLPVNNTIQKMLKVIRDKYKLKSCYNIEVEKNIPIQSGMAGGSSDAAAVLEGILSLENIECSLQEKIDLGKKVGADVPFCIVKKWARVQGIGEVIRPLHTNFSFYVIIVKPKTGVDTQKAFKLWHNVEHIQVNIDEIEDAIVHEDYYKMIQCMGNDLENASYQLVPEILDVKEELKQLGMDATMMSGSGSAVIGFSQDVKVLEKAKENLKDKYSFVEIVKVG